MVLLRKEMGHVLRARRKELGRTLRDVSASSAVSLGYLSEIERGEKEASSELLASICYALDMPVSHMLSLVARAVAAQECKDGVVVPMSYPAETRVPIPCPGMVRPAA